jgi:hypothetical protein
MRSAAAGHRLYDSVRGVTKYLVPQGTDSEGTQSAGLTSFNSDGFTVGSNFDHNNNNATFVAWCWKAGGTASSNSNGSVTSSVSANAAYGFSVVTFNSGSSDGNFTVGHGLNSAPRLIIMKSRSRSGGPWWTFHASVCTTVAKTFFLSSNGALSDNIAQGGGNVWGSSLPTNSVFGFSVGAGTAHTQSETVVAYCFTDVPGYQRLGSYTGNGSSTGPVVVTGFKPRFLMIKGDNTSGWVMYDSERDSVNPNNYRLQANSSGAESTGDANTNIDFLDNGFQLKNSDSDSNGSGVTYVYLAIGDDEIGSEEDCLVDVPNAVTADADATDTTGGYQRGNYATLNPLYNTSSGATLSDGNLKFVTAGSNGNSAMSATIAVSSGKWFWEITPTSIGSGVAIGIAYASEQTTDYPGYPATSWSYRSSGTKINNASSSSYGVSYTTGDVIGVALNLDAGTLEFYKNGVAQGTAFTSLSGEFVPKIGDLGSASTMVANFGQMRFKYPIPSGYAALNTTALPAATIPDGSAYFDTKLWTGNGGSKRIGGSTTAASSGVTATGTGGVSGISTTYPITGAFDGGTSTYLATNEANISSTAAVLTVTFPSGNQPSYSSSVVLEVWAGTADTVKVAINGGSYQTVSASSNAWQSHTVASGSGTITEIKVSRQKGNTNDGAAEIRAIIVDGAQLLDGNADNLSFQPDWVWIKSRSSSSYGHMLFDAVRGATNSLFSQSAGAEGTPNAYGKLDAFNSDGFTVAPGSSDSSNVNTNNATYVAWNWNAGTSTVSNTDGSITSTVRASAASGFSIVTWTGNQTNGSVGHGLSAAPKLLLVKDTDVAYNWYAFTTATGSNFIIEGLNTTSTGGSYSSFTANNSTVQINNVASLNTTGSTMLMYCFAPVSGFSAIGSYTGNASNDGPFVFTGFRVKWLMVKGLDYASNWNIVDATRNEFNETDKILRANLSNAEVDGSAQGNFAMGFDFLSNGFKVRRSGVDVNKSGGTLIWMAFAENPFQANGGLAR